MESLLREFIGGPVAQCCDRYEPRRCCFEIDNGSTRTRKQQTRRSQARL
jgi:hypothetical protein